MNVIGVSALYHDASCCLLRDGVLMEAAEEERFSRRKHDARMPGAAFRFCLEAGGMALGDIDCVAWYERPAAKVARQLRAGANPGDPRLDPRRPERLIREIFGWEGPIVTFPHHLSHAASAFFASGFDAAAFLTADGVGEDTTTSYGTASAATLDILAEVAFPHSLGLLYSTLTAWLGFAVNDGEGRVMGLAPFGEPRFVAQLRTLIELGDAGSFTLAMEHFDFVTGERMASPRLSALLGAPPRRPGEPLVPLHADVARSLQQVLEDVLLDRACWLHQRTGLSDLCFAGGVALNVAANGRLRRDGPFRRLFVPPAPGDAGGAIGAAALAYVAATGRRPQLSGGLSGGSGPLRHAAFGPRWSSREVAALIAGCGLPALDYRGRTAELLAAVAERLAGGAVVGWFHGALEHGPRALGGRSLLADPRVAELRDRLNRIVKRREGFRPFAPSVLAADADAWFAPIEDGGSDLLAPFMLGTRRVLAPAVLPVVTHVDGSARVHTVDPEVAPRFAALLAAFAQRTGCPVLVNTSFNVAGEPLVASPTAALLTFAATEVDTLVLEDFLLDRSAVPSGWIERAAAWHTSTRHDPVWHDTDRQATGGLAGTPPLDGGLGDHLYTFV